MKKYDLFKQELPNGGLLYILKFNPMAPKEFIDQNFECFVDMYLTGKTYSKFIHEDAKEKLIVIITGINDLDFAAIK